MKTLKTILTLIITVIVLNNMLIGQSSDLYKVKLRRDNKEKLIIYDTFINLEYLLQSTKDYPGITNFEFFKNFDYPILGCNNEGSERVIISNDSVKIIIDTKPIDTFQIKLNLQNDSNYYIKNPTFGIINDNLTDNKLLATQTEISNITVIIKGISKELPKKEYDNLFNPKINCNGRHISTKGYVTDNGEIIIQMENGDGANFYYVIFIFDIKGNLKRKIVENVI